MSLNHGDTVIVVRGKRRYYCKVLSDHTSTYPAITVEKNGEPWVISASDILTREQVQAEDQEKRKKEIAKVQDILDAYLAGHRTTGAIARFLNKYQVSILSRCLKAERMGLIKIERTRKKYDHKNTTKTSITPTPMPDLPIPGLVPGGGQVHPLHEDSKPQAQNSGGREPGLAASSGGGSSDSSETSPGTKTGTNS